MFVYPAKHVETGELYTVENFVLPSHLEGLFDYMKKTNKVEAIHQFNPELLHILSDSVLLKIQTGNESWVNDVPESVMKAIKFLHLFGYLERNFEGVKESVRIN